MRVRHQNIVRFVGYCYETWLKYTEYNGVRVFAERPKRLLCFEYIPNGSLDKYISDESCGLDWHRRYKIIKGICCGLHYLHNECQINASVIHLDLKPANILLDDNMVPKITDFGLSKLFDDQKVQTCVTTLAGSYGYMAPEYVCNHIVTIKADIYSLGVIIIEMITGRRIGPFDIIATSHQDFVEPIMSDPKELLEITPLELRFFLEIRKRIPCLVKLINKTDDYVAFYFGIIMAKSKYCIEPASGFLWPRSTFNVVVTMEEQQELPLDWQCNDEFLIQSIIVGKYIVTSKPITADLFNNMSSNLVNKVKLTVVYVPPEEPPSLSHIGSEASSSSLPSSSGSGTITYQGKTKTSDPQRLEDFTENVDILIMCICQDLGFSNGRPIAAVIIYRCLLHWKSFEAERTDLFERIIQSVSSEIEAQDGNNKLAYWLSNSSTLLLLLQRTPKISEVRPQRRRPSPSLFGRISAGNTGHSFDEAKHPVLHFKQQLTAHLEKIYGMIRDNSKKEISPFIGLCIQAPRTARASLIKSRSRANVLAQQTLIAHWQSIVPSFLIRKVFAQVFSFINVQLLNSLLLQRECCSFSNGEYVKAGLAELEQWCIFATEEYAGSSWDELKHVRQAVGFLVIHQKSKKTLEEITNDLCPVLSIHLYQLSTLYWDDKYGTHSVSSEAIALMRVKMTEDSDNSGSSSFLLDDDTRIPFGVDAITKSVTEFEVTDVQIPPSILEKCALASQNQRKD